MAPMDTARGHGVYRDRSTCSQSGCTEINVHGSGIRFCCATQMPSAEHATARCLSVRPSITRVYCVKVAEQIDLQWFVAQTLSLCVPCNVLQGHCSISKITVHRNYSSDSELCRFVGFLVTPRS